MEIAIEAADAVRRLGFTPRVAFLSYSTFGNPPGERSEKVREAVADARRRGDVDFEYEGEMPPDLALNPELRGNYPVHAPDRPGQRADHAGHPLGGDLDQAGAGAGRRHGDRAAAAGPVTSRCRSRPLSASVSQILNMATFAAYDVRASGMVDG